jgi:hypothetical protein
MNRLVRYLIDETGKNASNLVRGEEHHLTTTVKNRALVPIYGCFFADSVKVYDNVHKKNLRRGKDFTFVGLKRILTAVTTQAIYSVVIITNPAVSANVSIDYQCYGSTDEELSETTVELLEQEFSDEGKYPLAKIIGLPKKWKPTFHYHDLGDIDHMEYLLYCLERIRNAILYNNESLFVFILHFDNLLQTILTRAHNQLEFTLFDTMRNFTEKFSKELYGLGYLHNWEIMEDATAASIANGHINKNIQEAKEEYFSLLNLSAYATELFNVFVNTADTGLGSYTRNTIEARVENFEKMPIGAVFCIPDYTFSILQNAEVDLFFPDRADGDNDYLIKKITNDDFSRGQLYVYTGMKTSRMYVMKLYKDEGGFKTLFYRLNNIIDRPDTVLSMVVRHEEDYNNPHLDDKRDVDLSQVENLPVASIEEIICNMPVRKYITVRRLFEYMKRFKTGRKDVLDIYANYSDRTVKRQMQSLFTPCGAWDDNMDIGRIEVCQTYDVIYESNGETRIPTTSTTTTTTPTISPVYRVDINKTNLSVGEEIQITLKLIQGDPLTNVYWEFTGEGYVKETMEFDQDHSVVGLPTLIQDVTFTAKLVDVGSVTSLRVDLLSAPSGQLLASSPDIAIGG